MGIEQIDDYRELAPPIEVVEKWNEEEERPHIMADLGTGANQIILYPPKGYNKKKLSFKELCGLMEEHQIIPLRVGNDMMFTSWNEARLIFRRNVDQFLIEGFNIFPSEEKDEQKGKEIHTDHS